MVALAGCAGGFEGPKEAADSVERLAFDICNVRGTRWCDFEPVEEGDDD